MHRRKRRRKSRSPAAELGIILLRLPFRLLRPLAPKRPYWLYTLRLLGVGVGGGAIALGIGWWQLEKSLPDSANDVLTYTRPETLTLKAADGSIIKQTGPATREQLKISQMPKPLVQAFIAIEDRRFYQHQGVDYQGILRAIFSNLQAQDVVEGGSTITQQLARMVFFDQERSLWRKLREFRMAQRIEQEVQKEKILERYLNLVYLGEGAYGVADAAWVYFSKKVDRLTLAEMAMLAGLPAAPHEFSPFVNKEVALKRRNLVLQEMQKGGYITSAEAEAAIRQPLNLKRSQPKRLQQQAPYFTQYIEKELPKYVSPEVLKVGGLTVETSINPKWQQEAEAAVERTVEKRSRRDRFEQVALVAIDPRSGQIKVMVGGKDFGTNQFNRVTQAQRQPGSTFKVFVYTTAIAAGITPYQGYLDAPLKVDGYQPKNFSESYSGWLSMRDALVNSVNVVALKILLDVGWEPTINTARKMGIESDLQQVYSLALGGSEVNLLELTSAYGTLANKGMHVEAHGIRRIIDQRGKVIYEEKFTPERAVDEETSAIMTWLLRGVVNEGTGQAADLDDRPVAGKTGTSDEARDLLFVGYIPQLVTGVWLGNDNNDPTNGASSTAAYTWNQFMVEAVKDIPAEEFPKRPEKLEGRKPQIKVQPIKPGSIVSGKPDRAEDSDEDQPRSRRSRRLRAAASEEEDRTPRRRRSRRLQEASDEDNQTSRRRSRRSRRSAEATESTDENRSTSRRRRVRSRRSSDSEQETQTTTRRRRSRSVRSADDNQESRSTSRRRRVRSRRSRGAAVETPSNRSTSPSTPTRRSRTATPHEPSDREN
ncbi:MAG: penicillin-binding protein 1A [Cyanosarcina radialis HA8281-LM2]|nr:penicillin-binding protein 1A [Cyanosarcina radialis HA8281-LM2]